MTNIFNFPANSSEFSISTAYSLALAASIVYVQFENSNADKKKIQNQATHWGFSGIDTKFIERPVNPTLVERGFNIFSGENKNDVEAIIFVNSENVVVSIRGTEAKLQEWLRINANLIKSSFFGWGKVHKGFKRFLSAIWDDTEIGLGLESLLRQELSDSNKQLWFTGHSLGGATALLAASAWHIHHGTTHPVTGIYTYGQPRVGNQKFKENFEAALGQRMYRFVNNNDIVTQVPTFFYKHVGIEKYLTASGALENGDEISAQDRAQDRNAGRMQDLGKPGLAAIKNHAMGNWDGSPVDDNATPNMGNTYIDLLKALLD